MADPTPTKHQHQDILTQVQDEIDMLLNQMHSALALIRHRAPHSAIPGQPLLSSFAEVENPPPNTQGASSTETPTPVTWESFESDIREIAKDIILKEQQIETLIANLPGLKKSEEEQVEQMRELERELEGLEGERVQAVAERKRLVGLVEGCIGRVGGME
ncbi:hypothetical protein K504DRAFT_423742 [Pleomassaria siparia CBS 279.74]|uniref:Mediator of RNA polymerase II transcription subunit 21 n=1 Tax=Pleomassaria siparia CBS 279.74 TaxID=1314801 RepID=A0A6G1KLJ3_9PLEO|nr:hypothetical protein K504DRAFT_423742 [Pleomassaria siparia CBS 279.74]